MKCKHIIFTMAVLLLATAACENNRDNDLPGAKVCFLAEGLVESDPFYIVDEAPFVILRVFRSGYYNETATVSYDDLKRLSKSITQKTILITRHCPKQLILSNRIGLHCLGISDRVSSRSSSIR